MISEMKRDFLVLQMLKRRKIFMFKMKHEREEEKKEIRI